MSEFKVGDKARVTIEGEITFATSTNGRVRIGFPGVGEFAWVDPSSAEKLTDPVGDVTGVEVYVTGDDEGFGHGFAPGTLVEIVDDEDYSLDGTYYVKLPGAEPDETDMFIGASDLSIDPPVVTYGPGTVVQSKRSGSVYTVHDDGYFAHKLNQFFRMPGAVFNSERFTALTP